MINKINNKNKNLINLYLLSQKGLAVINEVTQKGRSFLINHVVIGKDKNVANDYSNEIKEVCERYQISWSYRSEQHETSSELIKIAVSWRWILPDTKNLIVFHDSLLPKYRGFAPLVNQLINGEKKIGVTALFATKEYDKGDIIFQLKTDIRYPINIANAIEKVLPLYRDLISYITEKILNGEEFNAYPQNEKTATYSLWRDERDYYIDWNLDANLVERFINAVGYPYAGAKAYLNNREIVIMQAEAMDDVKIMNRTNGKVIFLEDGLPVVVCGNGILKIKEAYFTENIMSIIPFKKFRSRFT